MFHGVPCCELRVYLACSYQDGCEDLGRELATNPYSQSARLGVPRLLVRWIGIPFSSHFLLSTAAPFSLRATVTMISALRWSCRIDDYILYQDLFLRV